MILGRVDRVSEHTELENRCGRIHRLGVGNEALFVFGNRYATDAFEATVPTEVRSTVDLVSRSGVVAEVNALHAGVKHPTRIKIRGWVVDDHGNRLNTLDHPRIPVVAEPPNGNRAKLILVVGTSMNSGKSTTAVAVAEALSSMGHTVKGTKVTGTASLKEILHVEDAGATVVADFTYLGYPSTYLLDATDVLSIFHTLDAKVAGRARDYWIAEVADGILQRETAMLLADPNVQRRIHRLVLCATDAFGAVGAIDMLHRRHQLTPAAISGIVGSSPLGRAELAAETPIPTFDAINPDLRQLAELLIEPAATAAANPLAVVA